MDYRKTKNTQMINKDISEKFYSKPLFVNLLLLVYRRTFNYLLKLLIDFYGTVY